MSNTYYKEDESANSYISPLGKEYADYNILQLISRYNVCNYRSTRYLENTSLFTDGHSFSMDTYSQQFKNGAKLNSGQSLGWEFTVNSVSNDSATITVKKI